MNHHSSSPVAPAAPRRRGKPLPARERLLAVATELFTKRGYAATSTREIVEGAGVTKPILYHHFGSKEGIFDAIVKTMEDELEAMLSRTRDVEGGALERLRALAHVVRESVAGHVAEVRLLHALYYGPSEGTPEVSLLDFPRKIEAAIGEIVRDGMRAGEIRRTDPRTATLAVQGALSILVETHLSEHLQTLGGAELDRLLELIFRGLASPAARPRPTKGPR